MSLCPSISSVAVSCKMLNLFWFVPLTLLSILSYLSRGRKQKGRIKLIDTWLLICHALGLCFRAGFGKRIPQGDNRFLVLIKYVIFSLFRVTNSNAMLLASAVVVWEWLNEHGRWRPYSPTVSHQIEAAIRSSDHRGGSVVLGKVDSRLSPYIIDLQSLHQFRQDTGKT